MYVLIILSFVSQMGRVGPYNSTVISSIQFQSIEACRAAAVEIHRQSDGFGRIRMACVPEGKK